MPVFAGAIIVAIVATLFFVKRWLRRGIIDDKERPYRKKARKKYWKCKGLGMLKYWWYRDEQVVAPCYVCFPDGPLAKQEHDRWERNKIRQEFDILFPNL